ncbi:hypothetical protein ACVBEH_07795 [Roseateles sp. GG27B]
MPRAIHQPQGLHQRHQGRAGAQGSLGLRTVDRQPAFVQLGAQGVQAFFCALQAARHFVGQGQ